MLKIFLYLCILSYTLVQAATYSGIIEPIKKVNLSLSIDGIIKTIKIKEGQKARKNSVILSLDSKIQQLEVKRRKFLLDDDTKIYYLNKEISIVKNMYNMSNKLYKQTGSISKNELSNYELKYYNLKSDLEEVTNNKKMKQIQYDLESEKLKLYTLRAPFKGVVTKIKLDIGEWGKRGEAIVEFVDSTTCFVETNIPESKIRNVKLNQKYTINIQRDTKTIQKQGKVTYISPIVDSSSGLILIKIEFNNSKLDVIPGVLATIDIETKI